ncbi:hypothetical protein PGT21_000621 [Puccinia graminis f. sp. tritici]|uniref:Uncharacterized protein n=1 Tax=Puccinia graminis f. sp. tritici TaxID=56615 RepID=A0A5B0M741_PUCGR|nr:hypothetical protein PGT21_029164 [Puccinia graminis f. sp. tritici]KAA1113965.1 hypothetical protein PGTUg99_023438 [Puccinia graminis f. sp. tritici]KAA1115815.1 hypothetical protein PGT21_000621 [Puccinia graminis f. sp. tritici]KAA1135266.1 hypothetical protein PGTUg99_023723 [Puccinia graminis f. sp. tritici]
MFLKRSFILLSSSNRLWRFGGTYGVDRVVIFPGFSPSCDPVRHHEGPRGGFVMSPTDTVPMQRYRGFRTYHQSGRPSAKHPAGPSLPLVGMAVDYPDRSASLEDPHL